MTDIFNQSEVQFNNFDLSHEHKTTMRFGMLYPVEWQECLPGDQWNIQTNKLTRFLPMLAPVMHRIRITEHWYFVPNRIMWDKWEDFITGKDTEIIAPYVEDFQMNTNSPAINPNQTLGGYLGLPLVPNVTISNISAFPLKAYIDIYNSYYRHMHLEQEITWTLVDGENPMNATDCAYNKLPLKKLFQKGYWTNMLNSAQRGLPVRIPLVESGSTLDVVLNNNLTSANLIKESATRAAIGGNIQVWGINAGSYLADAGQVGKVIDPNGQWALETTNAATIRTFAASLALQAFFEKDWRSDLKYIDIIKEHFRVNVPDYRLNEPEYLGGDVQSVTISEVLSQTETISGEQYTPLGTMAGHAISTGRTGNINYRCLEHGILMCIISVTPDFNMINRGVGKRWLRDTRLKYAWPTFAHLGDQPVYNSEIHVNHNTPAGTFGYTEQYKEYKVGQDVTSGDFQDNLKHWHLSVDPSVSESLSQGAFLRCSETYHDLDRIFYAEGDIADYFLCQIYFDMQVSRKLPKFNIPQFVG